MFDVAIIGFGPTGATLANLLAQRGVSVVVLERESNLYHLPRAVHFDGETMRIFQTVGIAEALTDKTCVNPGMRFVAPDGTLLMDWPRPQEIGEMGWHTSYRLHQPDLEKLLRDKLSEYDIVEIRCDTEVTEIVEQSDHVCLTCHNRTTQHHQQHLKARVVVGCDGANSFVRKAMQTEMEDFGFAERWLVVDVLLKRERPDLGDHSVQFCDPHRPMTYCRSPGKRRRWEIAVQADETAEEVQNEARIWDFLQRWITPEDADLERSAVYSFGSALARCWRKRRLMIAGDAAHLTPPFMGQGMCTGIRDTANLAWKLALCLQGQADMALLDSYQQERAEHAQVFINTAMRLGGLINASDPKAALEATQKKAGTAEMRSIAPPLGISDINDHTTPLSGTLFGQCRLSDGRWMDDVIGYAPVLISRSAVGIPVHLTVLNGHDHPNLLPLLNALDVDALLLRPDRYILATARGSDAVRKLATHNLFSSQQSERKYAS